MYTKLVHNYLRRKHKRRGKGYREVPSVLLQVGRAV